MTLNAAAYWASMSSVSAAQLTAAITTLHAA
jgi:hypothetical protein